MERVYDHPFEQLIPFIRSTPTKYDILLTELMIAGEKTKSYFQGSCFVTFNQPLYKRLSLRPVNILQMSLWGWADSTYWCLSWDASAGSGLKELLMRIYIDNSVEKILKGHAYSRAVRAHSMADWYNSGGSESGRRGSKHPWKFAQWNTTDL